MFVCAGCGTEVCDQCIHPDAELQVDESDSEDDDPWDVDDYVTTKWKEKTMELKPDSLGIVFDSVKFRRPRGTWQAGDPGDEETEAFICITEVDKGGQMDQVASGAFPRSKKLPWIINRVAGDSMPNDKFQPSADTEYDMDVIAAAVGEATRGAEQFTITVLYQPEVGRAIGQGRKACRRGGRRC